MVKTNAPIPADYRFTLQQLEYVQLRRQGWTVGKIAEHKQVTKQAVSAVLRRIGLSVSDIHDHPQRNPRRDKLPEEVRRQRRQRQPRVYARCVHCGQELRCPPRPNNLPSFCRTNERGCRIAYYRYTRRINPDTREQANARTRKWYWRHKMGPRWTGEQPVQHCAFCGVEMATYIVNRGLRACTAKDCRNAYYRELRRQRREE